MEAFINFFFWWVLLCVAAALWNIFTEEYPRKISIQEDIVSLFILAAFFGWLLVIKF